MMVPNGYESTVLGVIPQTWQVNKLGSLTDLVASGRTPAKSKAGTYPVYGSTGTIGRTDQAEYEGDAILVARVGANAGYLHRVSGRYGVTDNTLIIRVAQGCDLGFVAKQLEAKRLNSLVFGSGQPLITGKQLKALDIALPPLPEQRAIAATLSDVDALLDGLDRVIAKKRAIKQATMQQLLTGRTRLPGFSGEWEVKRLGDVADLYQPETIAANHFTDMGYPVYGANGVVGNYSRKNHSSWQVTVTCRGSTCGTVNRTVDECWITGNAMVLNCDSNRAMDKQFLFFLMSSLDLSVCITGSGQPQIVRTPLAAVAIFCPPLAEQTAIADVLSDMDAELETLEVRRQKTQQLKQGMMQELLTGRTRLV